jgi:Glycosyl hydrolases family 16
VSRTTGVRRARSWVMWAVPAALTLLLGAAIATPVVRQALLGDLASSATITASSSRLGSSADALVDGTSPEATGAEWVSNGETTGATVTLTWDQDVPVSRIALTHSTEPALRFTEGFLSFSDGSSLLVTVPSATAVSDISFTERLVGWVTLTVTKTVDGADAVGLAEVRIFANPGDNAVDAGGSPVGNAATAAMVETSSTSTDSDARAVVDGQQNGEPDSIGAGWTADGAVGEWVELSWARPREVSSAQLWGAIDAKTDVSSGTLEFSDGSSIDVGAVLPESAHPTTIAFMPRVITSVRFSITAVTAVTDSADAGLAEFAVWDTRHSPTGLPRVDAALSGTNSAPSDPAAKCANSRSVRATPEAITLVCPSMNTSIDGPTTISFIAPGMKRVQATLWAADLDPTGGVGANAETLTDSDSGFGELTIDPAGFARGPLVVKLQGFADATAGSLPATASVTYLQLYNLTGDAPAEPGIVQSPVAAGKTLAWTEEFSAPVTLSRTGIGADYASAKPSAGGPEEFGDAIFADTTRGLDNVTVVDDRYLRITVSPTPVGYTDPTGWDREHIGGMLASGRVGGSGFSAQYGYFEARMLTPAGAGLWPAFWMLPSTNLIEYQPTVAEVDAVEIYGHNPTANCQATHEYIDGTANDRVMCTEKFDTVQSALSWHVYGAEVSPTEIRYFIDGVEVARAPQVAGGDQPMFFMANCTLGGGWPIDLATMGDSAAIYVDYIRVYT